MRMSGCRACDIDTCDSLIVCSCRRRIFSSQQSCIQSSMVQGCTQTATSLNPSAVYSGDFADIAVSSENAGPEMQDHCLPARLVGSCLLSDLLFSAGLQYSNCLLWAFSQIRIFSRFCRLWEAIGGCRGVKPLNCGWEINPPHPTQ